MSTTLSPLLDETTAKLLDEDKLIKSEANAMESLDYDRIDSRVYLEQRKKYKPNDFVYLNFQQWVVTFLIGFFVALFGVFMDYFMKLIISYKLKLADYALRSCSGCYWLPYGSLIIVNVILTSLASGLCVWFAPGGAGSGIPEVKCYLNGIKVPEILRLKTLFVKTLGTICTVSGGLACGNEGPMIHIGSMLAAGISQGKSSTWKLFSAPIFSSFRNDHDKRDFVSGGAAAGIAGAFGAPVGGTLFSLEEGSSFWNQALTWRTFFCAIVASFTLNMFLSGIKDNQWSPANVPPSFAITDSDQTTYSVPHMPFFILLGIFGGFFGALFNLLNYQIMLFRKRYLIHRPVFRWIEVIVITVLTTTVTFCMTAYATSCESPHSASGESTGTDFEHEPIISQSWFCSPNGTNDMSLLFMGSGEMAVQNLFRAEDDLFSMMTLVGYTLCYYVLAMITLGVAAPSGLLVPCLAIGGGYGRLLGQGLKLTLFKDSYPVNIPTFAVIGAASFLGGTARMTISLCVILMETTGSVSRGLPIMVTLMIAKWVGDIFSHGIYDIHIALKKIPLLEWNPVNEMSEITAEDIMTDHVVFFYEVDRVSKILIVLQKTTHGGFPIISKAGILQGLILRSQLITLLKEKICLQDNPDPNYIPNIDLSVFTKDYPRYPSIREVKLAPIEKNKYINLSPYMNLTPFLIQKTATVDRVFRLFRTMGLRHLPVIDEYGKVVGMITRRDLAHFEERKPKASSSWGTIPKTDGSINDDPDEPETADDPIVIPAYSSFPKGSRTNLGSRKEIPKGGGTDEKSSLLQNQMDNLSPEVLSTLEPVDNSKSIEK